MSVFELKYNVAEYLLDRLPSHQELDDVDLLICQFYPDASDKTTVIAFEKYLNGEQPSFSTDICDAPICGYGTLSELGDWEFQLPFWFLLNYVASPEMMAYYTKNYSLPPEVNTREAPN